MPLPMRVRASGQITLAVTPYGRISMAATLVSETMAPFEVP